MSRRRTAAAAPPPLAIEGEFSIYRATELQALLQTALAAIKTPAPALTVDLAGVTEFDSAGVQLLLAAKQSAEAKGGSLRVLHHSPAVLDVFELLDLSALFGEGAAAATAAATH